MKLKSLFNSLVVGALVGLSALGFNAGAQINQQSPTFSFTAYTNFTAGGYASLYTNSAKISKITLTAPSANVVPALVNLYDSATTNSTFTNGAYTTVVTYPSNVVTTSISPLTGMTNIETNLMLVTGGVSVAAASNNPLPFRTFPVGAGTSVTYDVNSINSRGIMVFASTNVLVVVTYRIND